MRAAVLAAIGGILACISPWSGRADEWEVTPPLARVEGLNLFVLADGKAPCDFVRDRLLTSASFILNSSGIPFDDNPKTNEGGNRSKWAALVLEAHSLNVNVGCVWTYETTLYGTLSGGELMGVPIESRVVQIWSSAAFGSANGNGLTSYVGDYLETQMKMLVNDIHSARRRYPE